MRYIQAVRAHRLLFSLFSLFAVLSISQGVAGAAPQAITITPTSASPTIEPGATYKNSLAIVNQGQTGYSFSLYGTPYRVNGEAYTPEFTILPGAPNIARWFTFSQTGGYIKPGQTLTVNYTVSVPSTTLPGGYYAAVFAQTQPAQAGGSINLSERVGELFYLQVAGPTVHKGSLLTWQSSFLQRPPISSTIRIENSGSIHFPANIHLAVKDVLGHDKYNVTTTKELLPQTIRRITIPWQGSPSIGLFRLDGSADFLGQNHPLPTRWVLVMSSTVRIVIIAIILAAASLTAGQYAYQRKTGKQRKFYHRKG